MTKFTRDTIYGGTLQAEPSTSAPKGLWIKEVGHLEHETVEEFRDFLNAFLEGAKPPKGRFAAIKAVLTHGRGVGNLSRVDDDDVPWYAQKRIDGTRYFSDSDIESFEVLFEGFPEEEN